MRMRISGTALVAFLTSADAGLAQQKGQYLLGTNGLNTGIQPPPGFAYSNLATFYGADRLQGADGQSIPVSGSFDLRIDQNLFILPSPWKLFGGTVDSVIANGSLTAPQIGVSAGGVGVTDTYVQPFTLGYHFPRIDLTVNFGFVAPTGRFRPLPDANDNIASGYCGYIPSIAATVYPTKDKLPILSMFPGETYNLAWGVGGALPLTTNLLQFGIVGYSQWKTSNNGGAQLPALQDARYRVVAIGPQASLIVPKWNANFFFRYEPEFAATARVEGTTLTFGGAIIFPATK